MECLRHVGHITTPPKDLKRCSPKTIFSHVSHLPLKLRIHCQFICKGSPLFTSSKQSRGERHPMPLFTLQIFARRIYIRGLLYIGFNPHRVPACPNTNCWSLSSIPKKKMSMLFFGQRNVLNLRNCHKLLTHGAWRQKVNVRSTRNLTRVESNIQLTTDTGTSYITGNVNKGMGWRSPPVWKWWR